MMRLLLGLCLIHLVFIEGILSSDRCQGRCGAKVNQAFSCQCNKHCNRFGDCCSDYSSECGSGGGSSSGSDGGATSTQGPRGGCSDFGKMTEQLWKNDVNRLPLFDLSINDQAYVDNNDFRDKASHKLFSYVNESQLNSDVFTTYLALLDNYDPDKFDAEYVTSWERAEEKAFLDAVLSTSTLKTLYSYLKCQGKVSSMSGLRSRLTDIWFDLFKRSTSARNKDTSAFEHIFVGEYKSSTKASGFHYWLSFYEEEKSGEMNYFGHSCRTSINTVCAAYDWNGRTKLISSFFLRSSPAFDIAVYSACFIMYPGQRCPAFVDGRRTEIQTYSSNGYLTTAYIIG